MYVVGGGHDDSNGEVPGRHGLGKTEKSLENVTLGKTTPNPCYFPPEQRSKSRKVTKTMVTISKN